MNRLTIAPRKPIGATVILLVLLSFFWSRGTFDNVLYKVHANYKPCITNVFGATFCGDAMKEYERRAGITH